MSPLFNVWHLMLVSCRAWKACAMLNPLAPNMRCCCFYRHAWDCTGKLITYQCARLRSNYDIYVIHQLLRCAPIGYPVIKDTSPQESIIFRSFQGKSMRKKKYLSGTAMEDNILWLNWNYNTASDRACDTKSPLSRAVECWAKPKHLKHSVSPSTKWRTALKHIL